MKRYFLVVIAIVVASTTIQARLGETIEETANRYGKPTIDLYHVEYINRDYGDAQAWYEVDDVKLLIVFKDGKSQYESVTKKDTTDRLSKSEIRAFLDANSGTSEWLTPKETHSMTSWVRKDGGARGSLTADKKALTVMITKGGRKGF